SPEVVGPRRHGGNGIPALPVGLSGEARPDHADADTGHRGPRIARPHHARDRAAGILGRGAPGRREQRGAADQTDTNCSHAQRSEWVRGAATTDATRARGWAEDDALSGGDSALRATGYGPTHRRDSLVRRATSRSRCAPEA